MIRFLWPALLLFIPNAALQAQTAFDPNSVAYVLCVTNETKRLALMAPPIEKGAIVEQAFRACEDDEAALMKSLVERGVSAAAVGERISHMKRFIRQNAADDIDRQRINRIPAR